MALGPGIYVQGIAELQRALKALGDDLPRELRTANLSVAELIAEYARFNALGAGGVARHVEPSIVAAAQQRSASLAWGGSGFEMAGGAEFGAIQYHQFKPWTGNGPNAGYFIYPTIRSKRQEIIDLYDALFVRLSKVAFPD